MGHRRPVTTNGLGDGSNAERGARNGGQKIATVLKPDKDYIYKMLPFY